MGGGSQKWQSCQACWPMALRSLRPKRRSRRWRFELSPIALSTANQVRSSSTSPSTRRDQLSKRPGTARARCAGSNRMGHQETVRLAPDLVAIRLSRLGVRLARRRGDWCAGVLVALLLSAALGACGRGPQTRAHQLSSGRTIKVISVGQMHFTQAPPALVLSYQTDLKINQTEALRKEVGDIWKDFQKDVDQAKLASAIIMANEVPSGRLVQRGRSYNFVFKRNPDGSWPQEPPPMHAAP